MVAECTVSKSTVVFEEGGGGGNMVKCSCYSAPQICWVLDREAQQ